ncbi:hypothetical protein GCM10017056_28120 [Seohaeicola zhoushanensis]|uniref:Uncharacterized protein n=1 Tax=Seohaeicola zhoushanensis TaxID=1569283 RepID=A0A8J3M7T5_9RHOB|nr:hypothetical protein GCM10017056_28120 [Seohaeicola zhoushanensis]
MSGWWNIGRFERQRAGGGPLTLTLSPEGRGDAGRQAEGLGMSGWWGIGRFERQRKGGGLLTLTLSPEGRGDAGRTAEARA